MSLFTLVPSSWRVEAGSLKSFHLQGATRFVASALRRASENQFLASFSVELALCEEDGLTYWAPHAHGIVAGLEIKVLRRELRTLFAGDLNRRPVRLDFTQTRDVPIVLNYICKRVDTRKVRYFTESGRPRWRNGLPLRSHQQAEIDAWRSTFLVGDFYCRLGFKRNGRFLVRT
ncbi:hypothetical protein V5F44_21155 [Xanthobacter sp. V2C-8]|uniref:hypothetical protein n=1 Tax=Xanthobacter albus TaxID=3119929 RepID=UPI00372BFABA